MISNPDLFLEEFAEADSSSIGKETITCIAPFGELRSLVKEWGWLSTLPLLLLCWKKSYLRLIW